MIEDKSVRTTFVRLKRIIEKHTEDTIDAFIVSNLEVGLENYLELYDKRVENTVKQIMV